MLRTALFALALLQSGVAAASTHGGSLRGTVTAEAFGTTLPQVSVTLRSSTTPWRATEQTDLKGRFLFSEVPAGLYVLEAMRPGYKLQLLGPLLVLEHQPRTESVTLLREGEEPAPAGPAT